MNEYYNNDIIDDIFKRISTLDKKTLYYDSSYK